MRSRFSLVVVVLASVGCVSAIAAPPANVTLGVSYNSPTFRIYLTDGSGRRTGIDPNKPLDDVGEQIVNGRDYQLEEIPDSSVQQSNFENKPSTFCEFAVQNPSGIFVLNYSTDLVRSGGSISVELESYSPRTLIPNKVPLLAQNGIYKQLQISIGAAGGLTIAPIINSGDFLKDTEAACGLGSISPPEACEALEALAATAEKAKTKGDSRLEAETLELYLSILNRLHNWGQKGYRQDWDDFKDHAECDHLRQKDLHETKFFAKDPAYSALKQDAETMLQGLPKVGGHGEDGRRDGDDHHDKDDKK